MDWPALIDRLSHLAGIEPFYFDIHGERHATALDTNLQVLTALGMDVGSPAAAACALADIEDEAWRSILAPSTFRDAGTPNVTVDLMLPVANSRLWRWKLELETGEEFSGEFRAEELGLIDARDTEGARIERRRLTLPQLPVGYHRLRILGATRSETTIVAAPRRCYLPAPLERGQRLWGLGAHVYALRSNRNWGIGDFGDLKALVQQAGPAGASFVAVNPFHALSPGRPEHASPYSPSSRLFLNPLYVALDAAPHTLDELRRSPFVDYTRVWSAKGKALEDLAKRSAAAADFDAFCRREGDPLHNFATFMALGEKLEAAPSSWRAWPARYAKPDSAAVKRFAAEHANRVQFHKYLQFLADRQLGAVASDTQTRGMSIGLIRDLALGVDPDGADAWADQGTFVGGLRCGAPRDDFHPEGQEWGVLPLNPLRLRSDHCSYARLLRANMRHAGGLRIDHVIGVERQFVVPLGAKPADGCYLRNPSNELLSLIALESWRNKCMVIGEDLGTVPEGLRERMHDAQLFGCSIFYFEREHGGAFRAPTYYRKHAIASAGTHDLPTIAGYWAGKDIEAQARAGIKTGASADEAMARRGHDKKHMLDALGHAGVLQLAPGEEPTAKALRDAVHAYLTASAAQLFAAQVDDLLDEIEQLNLPGTVDAHPNWRRKLRLDLDDPEFTRALGELARTAAMRSASRDRQA